MRRVVGALLILASGLAVFACSGDNRDPGIPDSARANLKPRSSPLPEPTVSRTVYVPVYSSIYLGMEVRKQMVNLAATLSIRNISPQLPIVVRFVRYYDSAGQLVREYVKDPAELGPLASAEFIIPRADTTGGPGANFLVQWVGPEPVDEPIIEAVMIGQSGNAGVSFTSPGRNVKNEPR